VIEFVIPSGATLSAAMASATKLRRNTVVAVSTGKLDQIALSADARTAQSEDSMTIVEPLTSPLSGNKENNQTLSSTVTDSQKNHQLKKFSQSTPALPQLHYDLQDLGRSKSKQKKFLRHFPYVPRDERVLNRKCHFVKSNINYYFVFVLTLTLKIDFCFSGWQIIHVPWLVTSSCKETCMLHTTTLHFTRMSLVMSGR